MEFWVIKAGASLRAADQESFDALMGLPTGKSLKAEVKLPRNAAHHRLYWTLCHRIAAAVGSTSENVSDLLKIGTGHCDVIRSKSYGEVRLPKSISFASMDQWAFSEFFERCVKVIYEEWGIARKDVLEAVEELLVPTEAVR